MLDPAKLAGGLAHVAGRLGAVIHEETRVTSIERVAGGVRVRTNAADGTPGELRADHVVVATSAYSGWLRRLEPLFVPVYDYVLVSEPLTPDQRAAIGWQRRQGLSDANNQFHYFRLTADDRILWGGYDAIYHPGNGVGPAFDRRPATFEKLETNFRATFPQLADLRFPFRWGGAIDTTTRFTVTFGRTMGERGRLRARLHGAGRRRHSLGGRHPPRHAPATRLRSPPAALRPDEAVSLPAGAAPQRRRRDRPQRTHPGRRQ